jgi:hypothetical protein
MPDIIRGILLLPLAIILYASGLLLWPIRRWFRRKQKVRGRVLAFVFIAQLIAYIVVACLSFFIRVGHFYYWFIFLIELNIVFTLAGVIAWIRDAHYERTREVSHVA